MTRFILLFALMSCALAHDVNLSWQLSTCPMPDHQTVYRTTNCTKNGPYVVRVRPTNTTVEWDDTKVTAGATYCYYVTVTDIDGEESPPSNIIKVQIPKP